MSVIAGEDRKARVNEYLFAAQELFDETISALEDAQHLISEYRAEVASSGADLDDLFSERELASKQKVVTYLLSEMTKAKNQVLTWSAKD